MNPNIIWGLLLWSLLAWGLLAGPITRFRWFVAVAGVACALTSLLIYPAGFVALLASVVLISALFGNKSATSSQSYYLWASTAIQVVGEFPIYQAIHGGSPPWSAFVMGLLNIIAWEIVRWMIAPPPDRPRNRQRRSCSRLIEWLLRGICYVAASGGAAGATLLTSRLGGLWPFICGMLGNATGLSLVLALVVLYRCWRGGYMPGEFLRWLEQKRD